MKCNAYNEFRCRSCDYLDCSYQDTLKLKEEAFLAEFIGVPINKVLPAIGAINPEGSRNKAKFAVALVEDKIKFGIYNREMSFFELLDCPLHQIEINQIIMKLSAFLLEFKIAPYNLQTQKGELKYVLISRSESTSEIMIRFVLRSKESTDRIRLMAKKLQNEWPNLKVVSANIQPEHKAILEGETEIVFTEDDSITFEYRPFRIKLGVKSFFQVTSSVAQCLYQTVGNYLKDKKCKNVLDLYCGVGAFSIYVSSIASQVVGVEISSEAIEFANENKKINQIKNIEFKALDVESFLSNNTVKFDTIIVNPPRRGLGSQNIDYILKFNPETLIYSSCNVQSLRSDWELLKDSFVIESSQVFDMFPFSKHFEILITLSRIE